MQIWVYKARFIRVKVESIYRFIDTHLVSCNGKVPILSELLRGNDFVQSGDPISTPKAHNQSNIAESGIDSHEIVKSPSCLKEIFHLRLLEENSQLGVLYSTKVRHE
jgi:hypothetical protein